MTETTLEMEKQDLTNQVESTEQLEKPQPRRVFIPQADIFESEDAFVLTLDMPGVSEEMVDLTLEKDVLTISGSIEDTSLGSHTLTYREYRTGDYRRSFTISDAIDRDQIEATMKNGVLRVNLPKVEEVKTRKIEVRSA